jgi:hypothetical protein
MLQIEKFKRWPKCAHLNEIDDDQYEEQLQQENCFQQNEIDDEEYFDEQLQQENCFQLNEIDQEHYCERLQQENCFQLNEIDEEHYYERLQQVRSRLVAEIIESNVQSILISPLALYLNLFVEYAQLHKFLDLIIDVCSQDLIGLNYRQVLFPHSVNLILLM